MGVSQAPLLAPERHGCPCSCSELRHATVVRRQRADVRQAIEEMVDKLVSTAVCKLIWAAVRDS